MAVLSNVFFKGDVIFRQGDRAECMYDICRGTVGIYTGYGTDQENLLVELKAGACFGEMGMIDKYPRSATAVAMEDDTLLQVITEETFSTYFQENPEKVLKIMKQMSGRIRDLTMDYIDACRALAEAEESEKTGKEKSSWFKSHIKKFIDDYDKAMKEAAEQGLYPMSHDTGMWQ